jgi:GABA permease
VKDRTIRANRAAADYGVIMVRHEGAVGYLVVANQTLGGTGLIGSVQERAKEGFPIHVVVPATDPADEHASTEGTGPENAQRRLRQALERFKAVGVEADGSVGVADPMEAIRAALAANHCAGIIISTLPAGVSKWLHLDLPHRVEREFNLPVEWIEARSDDPGEATTVHIDLPSSDKPAPESG